MDSEGCHVLVVDDDASIRYTVSEALSFEGYQVSVAADGREALEVVARARPAIVLLDMRMPVMNGWEFVRVYRERFQQNGTRILAMTAAKDAQAWATEIQADGYLAKPFDLDELLAIVKKLCMGLAHSA